jgi:hypothetical protein
MIISLLFIYPSLEEENLHTTCVVDVDPISSLQSIGKNKIYISILPKHAQPYNLEDDKSELYPYQILSPFVIIVEPCHQFVKPHFQPTDFQTKIRDKNV